MKKKEHENKFIEECQIVFKHNQKKYNEFRENIFNNYGYIFFVLEGYNDFSYELGNLLDSFIPGEAKPVFQFILLRIHEIALKIFRETTILLENGSASGAMARWRNLYELSVVALFIDKNPELAEKYYLHAQIDDYKVARKLYEYKERLNLEDYNMDAYQDIKSNFDNLKEKYGWNGVNNYEWAKTDVEKNPNLFSLAKAVKLDHLYAYVDESHMYNHPSTRYIIGDRGSKAPNDNLKYMFTPFDMELPMQLIVTSLHQINCAAINGYMKLDVANKKLLMQYLIQNNEFPEMIIDFFEKEK